VSQNYDAARAALIELLAPSDSPTRSGKKKRELVHMLFLERPAFVLNAKYVLRLALLPWIAFPMAIKTLAGARIQLGTDIVDDLLLYDMHSRLDRFYFPDILVNAPKNVLILDIGAHHGIFLMELMARRRDLRAVAIEPDPGSISRLKENVRLNRLDRDVRIEPVAAAGHDGNVRLARRGLASWSFTTKPIGHSSGDIEVPARRVSSLLRGENPWYIKCNIEGAEFEVIPELLGAGVRPRLMSVFFHPEWGNVQILRGLIESCGYMSLYSSRGARPREVFRLA
jgi:FkbM family methyltransferase